MYTLGRGGSRRSINIWPGFVDGLSNLLLVVIFVLMVFMVAQFFLSVALTGKDEALTRLKSEINELAQLLALERSANSELRVNVEQLSAELQSSLASKESLSSQLAALSEERASLANQLAALTDERDKLAAQIKDERAERERLSGLLSSSEQSLDENRAALQQSRQALADKESELQAKQDELDKTRGKLDAALARMEIEQKKLEEALAAIAAGKAKLEDAYKTIDADKNKIEAQLAELAILKSLRDDLVKKLQASEGSLAASQDALAAQKKKVDEANKALEDQNAALVEQKQLSEEAQIQVTLLNRQLAALREQLARVSEALDLAETKNKKQEVQIADLGKRLNVALASKVQELARYRSEFFGRLREILGNRQDIRIVGDRFVFQSEILFASGSATIEDAGRQQLAQLASTLRQIAAEIPSEIDWVLRVDGHTDRQPISTSAFPSNWELSTARAVSVVKFLIEQGIPPQRLAATGFGEFQPLDPGNDEIAYRRNRRIEFKLTER